MFYNKLPRLSADLAITNDMDYAEALERKANRDCCRLTDSILKFAVKGRADLAKMLISHQHKLYGDVGDYYSALMMAVNQNYDLSVVKTLVDSGDFINKTRSEDGFTAVDYANRLYFMHKLTQNGLAVHDYLIRAAYYIN